MKKPKKRRRSRAKPGALPKGAYRLPTGGYVMKPRSVTVGLNGRRISIVAVRREHPDLELFAKALVALAREQVERESQEL
jgi:hypothetical protein